MSGTDEDGAVPGDNEPIDEPNDDAADATGGANAGFGPLSGGFQAFTDMQRQGIAAATEVAERFTAMLDGFNGFGPLTADRPEGRADGATPDDDAGGAGIGDLRASVARSVDLYTRLFQNTFEAYADLVEGRMRARGVRVGADATDAAAAVGPTGGVATGQLWVHNDTSEAVGPLTLRITAAESATGGRIAESSLAIEPARVEAGAGSSVAVGIAADLAGVEPGHYHALVLIEQEPEDALPVVIVVQAAESAPPS